MGDFYDDDYDELEDDDDEEDDDLSDGYKDGDDNDSGNGESWQVSQQTMNIDDRPILAAFGKQQRLSHNIEWCGEL